MYLVHILESSNSSQEGLFAVHYDDGLINAFEHLFDRWRDPEYMFTFCEDNFADIRKRFGESTTIGEAVNALMDEADELEEWLVRSVLRSEMGNNLQSFFKPLKNNESNITVLQLSKASVKSRSRHDPKLRIYALRVTENTYVVTGGAIKLTQTMQEREHTIEELRKLGIVYDWLKDNGILYPEDLKELL